MKVKENRVVRLKNPTALQIFAEEKEKKRLIDLYFRGEKSIEELNNKGVRFVRTIDHEP